MKRMLEDIAAEGGFISFQEGHIPYPDEDVRSAREAGLLLVRFAPGASIDVHYMLTDTGREMFGLPPTWERRAVLWRRRRPAGRCSADRRPARSEGTFFPS